MKKTFAVLAIFIFNFAYSQNQWAWMAGDNTALSKGKRGTIGVFAPTNTPPAILASPNSWKDKEGNFWLISQNSSITKDSTLIWEFNTKISQWRVVGIYPALVSNWGKANLGVWGTGGAPDLYIHQSFTNFNWVDTSGVFWIHGWSWTVPGGSFQVSLWKFDPRPTSPNYAKWCCVRFDGFNAIHGVKGVPSPNNTPGMRSQMRCAWTDKNNNLWCFGGQDNNGNIFGDLWRYSISTNMWTWMSGSNVPGTPPSYGTKGVSSPTNQPGGTTYKYTHWTDLDGNFWMVGGGTLSVTTTNSVVWKYDVSTNEWVWEAGSQALNPPPIASGLCVENATNNASGFDSFHASNGCAVDDCGNFWWQSLSLRLWKFNPVTKQYALIHNPMPRNVGVKGVFSATTASGSENYNAALFNSGEGFWVFTGNIGDPTKYYNDMFLYKMEKPTVSFSWNSLPNCNVYGTKKFTNTSIQNCGDIKNVKWNFGDPASGVLDTTSLINPQHHFSTSGTFSVKLVVTNCFGIKDSLTQDVTSSQIIPFSITVASDSTKCNSNTGTLTVNSTQIYTSGPFTYSLSNGITGTSDSARFVLSNLAAGGYVITITDIGGCTQIVPVNIPKFKSPALNIVASQPPMVCYGDTALGSVSINPSGASPFSALWNTGATSITGLTNLQPGDYIVTVTDANGCTNSGGGIINDNLFAKPNIIGSLTSQAETKNSTSCKNPNGIIGFYINTLSDPSFLNGYTYSINTGQASLDNNAYYTNLSPGTYTVTATSIVGCSVSKTFTITSPTLPAASLAISSNVLCPGGTGSVEATVSTPTTSPYTYSWSNGASATTTSLNNTITAVTSNIYTITITDGVGCSSTNTINLPPPNSIILSATQNTPASCGNNNGIAVATTATGGNGGFTYTWSNGAMGLTADNLASNSYTVTATDVNGCTQTTTVNISNSPGPTINSLVPVNPLCAGGNGSATVSATGTGTLTYTWSNSATGNVSGNLSNGLQTITVTDGNGCNTIQSFTITIPTAITPGIISPTAASCGQNNGSAVTAIAAGGTGSLNYSWSNGDIGVTATNLAAQTYTLTVKDDNNCTATNTVNINAIGGASISSVLKTDPLCNGDQGSVTVSISGGVSGNYTYSWAAGQSTITASTTSQISNLTSGTYTLTVTDGICSVTSVFTIIEPTPIIASATQNALASCGLSNGSAIANASGGNNSSYNYAWTNGDIGTTASLLSAGTYVVTITDGSNCTKTATVNINNSPAPTINSITPTPINCNGGTGGAIVNATGTGLSYVWSNGNTLTTATNLSAGNHNITVTDGNGCKAIQSFSITEPALLEIKNPIINLASCSNNTAAIAISLLGGTGLYTYSWSNGTTGTTTSTTISVSNLSAQIYTLNVVDANGCMASTILNVGNTPSVTITNTSVTTPLCNGGMGSATVAISGGTGPNYNYSWSNGASSITTATSILQSLSPNTYTVTVTDANNCTASSTIFISQPALLSVANPVAINENCNQSNGTIILLTPTGGIPSYTYSWSNGKTTSTISNLSSQTYTVTITDNNNCSTIATAAIVNIPGTITANASATTYSISEGETTTLSASGGSIYSWTPSSSLSCATCPITIATPIANTTYTLIIKDNVGCSDTTDIIINVKKACSAEEDIFIANLFSPNNDGKNDVLMIQGNGLTNIYWSIYDRWGNLVFESRDQAQGWDGSVKGNTTNTGTYVYYLKGTCKKTNQEVLLKGNVSVVK